MANNGAGTCPPNVFWQIGSSATLGTGTSFVGNILALTSITLNAGTVVNGRTLARNGAVTLSSNNLTACPGAGGTVPGPNGVPVLGPFGLLFLVILLAGVGLFALKRSAA